MPHVNDILAPTTAIIGSPHVSKSFSKLNGQHQSWNKSKPKSNMQTEFLFLFIYKCMKQTEEQDTHKSKKVKKYEPHATRKR